MKKVAVVILNWNGEHLLRQFLPGITTHSVLPEGKVEVVVADNGSTDTSEVYVASLMANTPNLRWLPLGKNYGFAEGYNRALDKVDAEYVVLLNDDVEVTPHWLEPLIGYMDTHREVAACQPKLLSQCERSRFEYAGACGGYLDRYGYPYCRGRLFESVEEDCGQYDTPASVLWGTGACLFIRLKTYREVGGFDSRFFAHMEEVDLCWRLRISGKDIVCVPLSTVYHVGGASLATGSPRKTYLNFRNNLLMLYKNLPKGEVNRVLFVRRFFDVLAAFVFLLKGERSNFLAVFKARKDFRRMKKEYSPDRHSIDKSSDKRSPFCLLWQYHILRRRTFSALPGRKK
jgi:GT2 family glycosyltransferase